VPRLLHPDVRVLGSADSGRVKCALSEFFHATFYP
jgi:hypothetical protein